jgi:hypothetical protein
LTRPDAVSASQNTNCAVKLAASLNVFALNLSQAELVLYFQFSQQFQIKLYDLSWPKMKNNDRQMQMKTNPPLEKKKKMFYFL